jgi:hypothetical protein
LGGPFRILPGLNDMAAFPSHLIQHRTGRVWKDLVALCERYMVVDWLAEQISLKAASHKCAALI